MPLKIALEGGTIRSVGDPPNGILCVAVPGGERATFVIDGGWQPPPMENAPPGVNVTSLKSADGLGPDSTEFPIAEVLDACAGRQEVLAVLRYPAYALATYAQENARREAPFDVETIRAHLELLTAMREELIERGWLVK